MWPDTWSYFAPSFSQGSSPAAGCLLAVTCDYRIMADNARYTIGLNETQLGIVAPFWSESISMESVAVFTRWPLHITGLICVCRFKDTMVNTVGYRTTELALQLGQLYSSAEALQIGLVDKLVPEDQVITTATQTMTKWLAIPGMLYGTYDTLRWL